MKDSEGISVRIIKSYVPRDRPSTMELALDLAMAWGWSTERFHEELPSLLEFIRQKHRTPWIN